MFLKAVRILFFMGLILRPSWAYSQMFDPTVHISWTQDLQLISTSQSPLLYWTTGSGPLSPFGKGSHFLVQEALEWLKEIDLVWVKNLSQDSSFQERPGYLELYDGQGQLIKEWKAPLDVDSWLLELKSLLAVESEPRRGAYRSALRDFTRLGQGQWKMMGPRPSELVQTSVTKDYVILEDRERNLRFALPWQGGKLWYSQTRDGIWYPLESLAYVRD